MAKNNIHELIREHQDAIGAIALAMWEHPEGGFQEVYGSNLQKEYLTKRGYRVTAPVGDVETGFIAEYGSGSPVIGFLGELDALPGLSQKVALDHQPIEGQSYGHACGHHLLGAGSLLAFLATAEIMKRDNLPGTIRYYGCPAEESFGGKSYMARTGCFEDLDCALTWHPDGKNGVIYHSTTGFQLMEFHFYGKEAHAGVSPHMGRSALDAVELMDVGANYLREHIPDGCRIHYIITDGGLAVNIVPGTASVRFAIRAPEMTIMEDMYERLVDIARGAALMTGTKMEHEIKSRYYNVMPNYTLNDLMMENLRSIPAIEYTKEESDFLNAMSASYTEEELERACHNTLIDAGELENGIPKEILKIGRKGLNAGGSSDIGDVSWITPMSELRTACCPIVVAHHTWQATACFGTSFAVKGMAYAAETLALTTYDLFTDHKDLLSKAKEELKKDLKGKTYKYLPEEMHPYHD